MSLLQFSPKNLGLLLLVLFGTNSAFGATILPSFNEVKISFRSSDGKMLDRNGEILQELRLLHSGRSLDWVEIGAISPALIQAVVNVEDIRFREHGGVDARAMAGAIWQNLTKGKQRGASTISMQTVSLLEDKGAKGRRRRSMWEKFRQAQMAVALERDWTKDQILEAYLNLVTFRGEFRGVLAASRALFGKDPHGLNLKESFLLAALLREPGISAKRAGDRLCVLSTSFAFGPCPDLRRFVQEVLAAKPEPLTRMSLAPHLAKRLLKEDSQEVRTTIDASVQRFALQTVRDQLQMLQSQNARDSAVIVANNRTGEVLAYVGGSGSLSASPQVDMARAFRQAGSTLKPFLYALAFEKKYFEPDSWVLDEPFEVGLERGSYEPDNYDHSFHGPVKVKEALASSLNIPAVRVLNFVGVEAFQELLERLQFKNLETADHYGPSLALGTADISLLDLVQGYMTLANEGLWRPLRFRAADPIEVKRVLTASAASDVAAILADRDNRGLTFGWDSVLATPYSAAVKTGTSKDMRDNWCIGSTRDFTVGVWVGNASGDPMWQVSGVTGAAPIWRSLMDYLHKNRTPRPFLARKQAAPPPVFERAVFGRILYPQAGALIALDPDIPLKNQLLPFEADGEGKFFLNGNALPSADWQPQRGKHLLSFRSQAGKVLDELSFEVR